MKLLQSIQRPELGSLWRKRVRAREGQPLILGHRGASAVCPENTLAAFAKAMELGADGFELDVRLCRSGELLVFHDDDLKRLCGDPRNVKDLSWSELSEMTIQGAPIPLLSEVLAAFPEALVNVEMKSTNTRGAYALVAATAKETEPTRSRILISSFDPRLLSILAVIAPQTARALLCAEEQPWLLRKGLLARLLRVTAIHPQHTMINEQSMEHWRKLAPTVNTWTVDDPGRQRILGTLGVDALITNTP